VTVTAVGVDEVDCCHCVVIFRLVPFVLAVTTVGLLLLAV
jgi:hypothetical protein